MNAAGPYPVYAAKPENLIVWERNNESILNQDVVVGKNLEEPCEMNARLIEQLEQ